MLRATMEGTGKGEFLEKTYQEQLGESRKAGQGSFHCGMLGNKVDAWNG